ncbi:MAG TPA: protein translocase subunit SecD [Acidobacteriota bacterium]|nr:protein translocase subunit SecD [Acidobacteriota bacterium]HNT17767.1 protein translocase subunit SecD [Acidobacteriota bacterium]
MKDNLKWKGILIALVTLLCVFFYYFNTKAPYFNPKGNLKLGLDLKGGVHLLLLMNTDVAVSQKLTTDIITIEGELKKKNMAFDNMYPSSEQKGAIVIEGKNPGLGVEVKDIADRFLAGTYSFSAEGGGKYNLKLTESQESELRDRAITQSVEIIRNRIDRYGVAETAIHRQGLKSNKIVVELPGIADSTEVKALIGKAAQLGWHLTLEPKTGSPSKEALLQQYEGRVPDDAMIVPFQGERPEDGQYFVLVKKVPIVTGGDIQNVQVEGDEFGQPAVGFELTLAAGKKFREFTRANVGNHAAILLDNSVISNPVIQSEIGEKGIIQGHFTPDQARHLVLQLKSGSLPAIPEFGEERTVGPSLGLDAIRRGTISGLIGLLFIFSFMLAYYHFSGINAIVTLLLNFVMIMGIMSTFGMTLTVPGIAGIILTIGMAVDANVLIFERIRDEVNEKKTVLTAISNGFSKALSAIIDSNLTTIISALFLFQFGTGPIKGFAVSLIVGLLASMFTAVFVSRWIYDMVMNYRSKGGKVPVNTISVGPTTSFRGMKFPWFNYTYFFVGLSVLLIAVGIFSLATKGLNWGIDFRGGQEVEVKYSSSHDPRLIESELRKKLPYSLTAVRYGDEKDNELLIRIDARDEKGNALTEEALAGTLSTIRETLADDQTRAARSSGKVDLNNTNAATLADLFTRAITEGRLGGSLDQCKAIADSVMEVKKNSGGILTGLTQLKGAPMVNDQITDFLSKNTVIGNYSLLRIDTVGPTIGKELRKKSSLLVFWSLLSILVYAWFRFKLRFGVGAIVALIHDGTVALGLMSLFGVEMNIPAIAALLTLLGYSINDTIVIFDRVREHMTAQRRNEDREMMQLAINETFSRTIITNMLTAAVVFSMLFFGGEAIYSFAFVLSWGIIVGTYSTIFVASPVVLWWNALGVEKFFSRKSR